MSEILKKKEDEISDIHYGLACGICGISDSKIIESREQKKYVRRRHVCKNCGNRFSTREYLFDDIESLLNIESKYNKLVFRLNKVKDIVVPPNSLKSGSGECGL